MCQNVQPLARDDAQHWVSCCEHGTVFLTWQNLTWSLDPMESVHLSTFVTCAAKADCVLCRGDYALYPPAAGVQLWIAEAGALSVREFERLRDLLENALWALQKTPPTSSTPYPTAPQAQKVVN